MRLFLLFVFFTGLFLVVTNQLVKQSGGPVVEYRYVSRDLDTYLRDEQLASVYFKPVFDAEDLSIQRAGVPQPWKKKTLTPSPA